MSYMMGMSIYIYQGRLEGYLHGFSMRSITLGHTTVLLLRKRSMALETGIHDWKDVIGTFENGCIFQGLQ